MKTVRALPGLVMALLLAWCTPPAAALDLQEVHIQIAQSYTDGVADDNPWFIRMDVVGIGLGDVSVTPPGKAPQPLVYGWTDGSGWDHFVGQVEDYATLAALQTDYPAGLYALSFNGGDDTDTLLYNPTEPEGLPIYDYPTNGAVNVPTNTGIYWDNFTGVADVLSCKVWYPWDDEDIRFSGPMPTTWTSWWVTPELYPNRTYQIGLGCYNGVPALATSDGSDNFMYYPFLGHLNFIEFTTIPEPLTLSLLALGGLAVMRRKGSR